MAADSGQQFERREAAVGDEYQTAIWQPAFGLQDRLPGPRRQRLVALAIGFAPARRGRQDRQERQSPCPLGPGYRHRDHQRQPAQAAGLDEVALGGSDRVTIDAARVDTRAPAALDGVVNADHHLAVWQQSFDYIEQQPPCDGLPIPACPAQHLMIATEARLIRQPHDAQHLGDGALARSQHRASHQNQDAVPDRGGETGAEYRQPSGQDRWDQMRVGRCRGDGMVRCHYRCRIEVAPAPQESPAHRDIRRRGDLSCAVMTDPIIQRIESFRCRRGQLVAERRNRGYTLYRAGSGHADRATASDRTERSCRGALLVAMEGTLDQRRAVRADHPAHRRGPAVHRFRGHLLGRAITGAGRCKMRKVQLSSSLLL